MIFLASLAQPLRTLRLRAFDRKDRQGSAKFAKKIVPRVLVETPAPPALREERIGKETAAGIVSPVFFSVDTELF
jgi:hypothetical protein